MRLEDDVGIVKNVVVFLIMQTVNLSVIYRVCRVELVSPALYKPF